MLEECVGRSLRLSTAKVASMPSLRPVPPYGCVGSIIEKDRIKISLVFRKRCRRRRFEDGVARGTWRPSLRPCVAAWMGRVGVEMRRVTWYVYARKSGILSSKYGM